ncbi:MAG TPA: ATP-binding protein [Trueperaceae bacterium]
MAVPPRAVHLMCGLTGAGKTTLARRLERTHHAVRFSIDEWMIRLYGQQMPREQFDERHEACEGLIWDVSRRLLALDVDVILDFGFWTRQKRAKFKRLIEAEGSTPILYVHDLPLEVLRERLQQRNRSRPESAFEITEEMLRAFALQFESPEGDEGFQVIRVGRDSLMGERHSPRG